MNSHDRDIRPAERSVYALLRPPPSQHALRYAVPMALVLLGLVACGFHAGNPAFGLAAALSLAALARTSRRATGTRSTSAPDPRR